MVNVSSNRDVFFTQNTPLKRAKIAKGFGRAHKGRAFATRFFVPSRRAVTKRAQTKAQSLTQGVLQQKIVLTL